MRAKEYSFKCTGCGSEFEVITTDEDAPEICCFCGEDLDNEHDADELDEE